MKDLKINKRPASASLLLVFFLYVLHSTSLTENFSSDSLLILSVLFALVSIVMSFFSVSNYRDKKRGVLLLAVCCFLSFLCSAVMYTAL